MRQAPPPVIDIEIPNTLRFGDAIRVLSRAMRARYSRAIAFKDDSGIRRIVLRDSDFVMSASGIEENGSGNYRQDRAQRRQPGLRGDSRIEQGSASR